MNLWEIGAAAYILTILVALILTHHEQRQRGQTAPARMLVGYVLCTVWPLVAAVLMMILYRSAIAPGGPE